MQKVVSLLFLVSSTLVNGGFLTGHHPYPAVLSSRTIISGAVGGGPTNGAYSSSQSSQTVSSPAQVHSSVSTYHPIPYGGYSGRQSQIGQGQNQGGQSSQGQSNGLGQGQGGYGYGYNSNNPSVLAYGTYGFGQGQNGQVQSGQGGGYGNQGQRGYSSSNGGGQGTGTSTHGYGYY